MEDAKAEEAQAIALVTDRKDPAAQARDHERMIKARTRKLLDFYGLKASKNAEPMTKAALVATAREEEPLGVITSKDGAKAITEEEKEMLEMLRSIGGPSAAAQAAVVAEEDDGVNGDEEKPKRLKIKDARQKEDIATARMGFLFGVVSS